MSASSLLHLTHLKTYASPYPPPPKNATDFRRKVDLELFRIDRNKAHLPPATMVPPHLQADPPSPPLSHTNL